MLLANKIIELSGNAMEVFDFVTNIENYAQWFPGVVAIRSANALAHAQVGKQYVETLEFPDGVKELVIEVKKSVKYQVFETEGDLAPLLPGMTMLFSTLDQPDTCELNLSYRCRNSALSANDDFIVQIKEDLNSRIEIASRNLVMMF